MKTTKTMKTRRIRVSQNMIDAADLLIQESAAQACFDPISIALSTQTDFRWFTSDKMALSYSGGHSIALSKKTLAFLRRWFDRKQVSPFVFACKIPHL